MVDSAIDCPTAEELYPALLRLLPPGEAWQMDQNIDPSESVQRAYWTAISKECGRMEEAFCLVWQQLYPHSATTDADLWLEELGMPDERDAFGSNYLAKIRAVIEADGTAEYFEARAADLGWTVSATWQTSSTLHLNVFLGSPILAGFEPAIVGQMIVGQAHLGNIPQVADLITALETIVPAEAVITYTVVP